MFLLSKWYFLADNSLTWWLFICSSVWESGQCSLQPKTSFPQEGHKEWRGEGELAIPLLSRIPWIRAGEVTSRERVLPSVPASPASHHINPEASYSSLTSAHSQFDWAGGAVGTYNCSLCGELWMRQMQLLIRRNIRLRGNTTSFVQLYFGIEHRWVCKKIK